MVAFPHKLINVAAGFSLRQGRAIRALMGKLFELFAKPSCCYLERGEGSQVLKNARFFASLRMTFLVNADFTIASFLTATWQESRCH
jgi:hypothetical protein